MHAVEYLRALSEIMTRGVAMNGVETVRIGLHIWEDAFLRREA